MNTAEARERIFIPGKPEEVDVSRVHGDIGSGIRFELRGKESYFNELPDFQALTEFIGKGGRVFITENDEYLLIDPLGIDKPVI